MTSIQRKLFGTDGVRWIINVDQDPSFAFALASAIASYFPPGSRVLVGRDARLGSSVIYGAVLSGLLSAGSKVYDAGLAPTPVIQFGVSHLGFDYGVVVTASHNPPEWVGIKVVLGDGIEAPPHVDYEIERLFFENKYRRMAVSNVGELSRLEGLIDIYVDQVSKFFDKEKVGNRRPKIVVDAANSVSALTTPKLLRRIGAKVLTLNADLDSPFRPYEPTPENIAYLSNIVKSVDADYAVAHDGDGDRAIFIDNKGRFIPGDVSAVILTDYISEKHKELPRRVVVCVAVSHLLINWNLAPKGIEVVWTQVGFPHIARKIKELSALSGFEENGGFAYVPVQPVRDGTATAALMAELISVRNTSLAELVDELKLPSLFRTKIPIPSRNREDGLIAVDRLKSFYQGFRRIEIDGLKVLGDDFAFLVRVSGTEPIIRIMIEAVDDRKAQEIYKDVYSKLSEIMGVSSPEV